MGRCDVCGEYGVMFGPRHLHCMNKLPSLVPASDASQKAEYRTAKAFILAPLERRILERPPIQLPAQGLQMQVRVSGRDYRIPQPQFVVSRLLSRAKCYDMAAAAHITAKLLSPEIPTISEDDFHAWCRSEDAPQQIRAIDYRWNDLLLWTGRAVAHGLIDLIANKPAEDDGIFQYRMLAVEFCSLPSHRAAGPFVAKYADPLWEILWPPNGWLCGCRVIPLMAFDPEVKPESTIPGIERLTAKELKPFSDWYTRSVREAWKLL